MVSGCKGKPCVHVGIAAIEAGMVNIGYKRRISKFTYTKGVAKKNRKQQLVSFFKNVINVMFESGDECELLLRRYNSGFFIFGDTILYSLFVF